MSLPDPVDPTDPVYEEPPAPVDPGTDSGTSTPSSPTSGGGEITVTTGSRTLSSVSQAGHTATYVMTGSFAGNTDGDQIRKRVYVYNGTTRVYTANAGTTTASSASWDTNDNSQTDPVLTADDNQYSWRARVYNITTNVEVNGTTLYFKSAAVTAVVNAPTAPTVGGGTLEPTQAYITCTCEPNTNHSLATLQLQYKLTTEPTLWTDFGSSADTSGYATRTISRQLTGLTPATSYDVRLKVTRTTVNETLTYGASTTFVTPVNTPTITTVAASSIGYSSAIINATVAIGNQSSVNVKWIWGTASDLTGGTLVAYDSNPVTASGSVSYNLSGLTNATTYYFRAEVYWNSDASSSTGSILSFATGDTDPTPEAGYEDHMITQYVDGIYGTAKTVYFTLRSPSGTSSNEYYTGTAPVNTDDIEVWMDGVSQGAADNTCTRLAGTVVGNALYSLEVAAAEMAGDVIDVIIHDATATEAFRDHHIQIRTKQTLSSVVVDASNRTNTSAMVLTGVGSGHGLSCVGGATGQDINGVLAEMVLRNNTAASGGATAITLDTGATTTADFYNGCIVYIIGGTGAGQARVITDYSTGRVCTVHKAWSTNPANDSVYVIMPGPDVWEIPNTAELAAIPAVTATWRELLTFLFQRFKFKRTQTATTHTMYKDDGSTSLGTAAVSDSAGTQTFNELA